jgi:2,3-bisphosphoglycerate-dependent phosphoglycerate mutase
VANERSHWRTAGLNKGLKHERHGETGQALAPQLRHPAAAAQPTDPRHARFDPRYQSLAPNEIPATESLKDTLARVQPYWEKRIAPELKANRNVLIVAHGNSQRALVKMLDRMSDQQIVDYNIPTGIPLLYELDDKLQKISSRYLGDQEAIKKAAEAVKRQSEAKR